MSYNPTGDERGGVGHLDSGRSIVALDRKNGEGVYMTANERSGFAANYEATRPEVHPEAIRLGTTGASAYAQSCGATARLGGPSWRTETPRPP